MAYNHENLIVGCGNILFKDDGFGPEVINYMKENDVHTVFHYVPLHSAPAGLKFGRFAGEDVYTTKESERLVRLPLYYGLAQEDLEKVIRLVYDFFAYEGEPVHR